MKGKIPITVGNGTYFRSKVGLALVRVKYCVFDQKDEVYKRVWKGGKI